MKRFRMICLIVVIILGSLFLGLFAYSNLEDSIGKKLEIDVLKSEEYSTQLLSGLSDESIEMRRITETSGSLVSNNEFCIEFANKSMALSAPLLLIQQAEEKASSITMRYSYPEGHNPQSVSFKLPDVSEYELYFPNAAIEEISVLVANVSLSQKSGSEIRSRYRGQGCTVADSSEISYTLAFAVHEGEGGSTAMRLDTLSSPIVKKETGTLDELEARSLLYLSSQSEVYKPAIISYEEEASTSVGVAETYLYGSLFTAEGSSPNADYSDIVGHYAESAIKQTQLSYNMAYAMTPSISFAPDEPAGIDAVFSAFGHFFAIPSIGDDDFKRIEQKALDRYSSSSLYKALFSEADVSLADYVSYAPNAYTQLFENLDMSARLEKVMSNGLSLESRINVVLGQIGAYQDRMPDDVRLTLIGSLPDAATTDQWLIGIADVAADDPLRPYAAIAVHYGLLFPDGQGSLNLYGTITRADLCLSYASLEKIYQEAYGTSTAYSASTRYSTAKSTPLPFDPTGLWHLTAATKANGVPYTQEEIDIQTSAFVFTLGSAIEQHEGQPHGFNYVYYPKERIVRLYHDNGQFRDLQMSDTLDVFAYIYENIIDPERNGEVHYYSRA